jgi:hypothetical protein
MTVIPIGEPNAGIAKILDKSVSNKKIFIENIY